MSIVDRGIPVISLRQSMSAVSPNAANNGWNFIVVYGGKHNWTAVIKNLTTSPSVTQIETLGSIYGNSIFNSVAKQLRAQNGRIFFPYVRNFTGYYDPVTEAFTQIGPVVEVPPINPNASTIFYAASFDVGGLLYFATQESQKRPSCIVVTDTTTTPPLQTVVGYVGDSAADYTTYGYRIAPDTATSKKYIYVVYGQNPWQLWALEATTGVAVKLYEVPSSGNIVFINIVGKGWVADIHTALGKPDDVRTFWWCLDGERYPYTAGQDPPNGLARNVTPASNPLVNAPTIDPTGNTVAGVVGWRIGSSGPFTYVDYPVNDAQPIEIEALVTSNDGIVGNAASYFGWIKYVGTGEAIWYGGYTGISGGPRLNLSGIIYLAGYPNGVLWQWNPAVAWQPSNAAAPNPKLLGYVGLNGTQFAGIKYVSVMQHAPLAGTGGRLYICGTRQRNGEGSGIGSYDLVTKAFAGTFSAAGMSSVNPTGLVVLSGLSRVVMATSLRTPPGTANLLVFDYSLNLVATLPVITNLSNLGSIYETSTPNVITGIVQGSGNSIGLWQYNVQTETFIDYVEVPIIGVLGTKTRHVDKSVWLMSGNVLVRIDLDNLTASVLPYDVSTAAPVTSLAFSGDTSTNTLFLTGGANSGVSGAQVFSINLNDSLANVEKHAEVVYGLPEEDR